MLKDRKIKRNINKAMDSKESFSEFCDKHDIEINGPSNAKQDKKRKQTIFKAFVSIAAAAVVFLGIFLPLRLSGKQSGQTPENVKNKPYGESSVDKTRIDVEQIIDESNVLLFNMEYVGDISEVNRISPKEDNSKLLGYYIRNVLYGVFVENELYAYEFDYMVRCYKNYSFMREQLFHDLDKKVIVGKIDFTYKVNNGAEAKVAYISFQENNIEYFIYLRAFDGAMEINEETVVIFLQNFLPGETTNEKINYQSK